MGVNVTVGETVLTMKGIDKFFPGVHALDHVDFDVRRGEVHALMGENGAGKSTLMKVLTGIYAKDEGTITYEGREVSFSNPREAQEAGIVIVHQELNMINHLTVAQNIFIGREPMRGFRVDDKKMIQEAQKLFDMLGIDISPTENMGSLTVGRQQMCEIAKAISHDAKVIVFDEPTAALTASEIEQLFKIIRELREKGLGIVYISHRMDEIKVITDRVTVMRDGSYVGTLITSECTKDDIIKMMVGRTIFEEPKTKQAAAMYKALGATRSCLTVIADDALAGDANENFILAVCNLPNVDLATVAETDVYMLCRYKQIVVTPQALEGLMARLARATTGKAVQE